MSEFECNVKDLEEPSIPKNNQDNDIKKINEEIPTELNTIYQQKPQIEDSPGSVRSIKREKNDVSNYKTVKPTKTDNNSLVKDTTIRIILNDIKDKKNHRMIMVILFSYIILNSSQVYKIFNDMFPYLMESINQVNIKGQFVIAMLISLAVIISKSSLLNQP